MPLVVAMTVDRPISKVPRLPAATACSLVSALAVLISACTGPVSEARPLEAPAERSDPPIPSEDIALDTQIELGKEIFIDRCSGCHAGSDGDDVAPPLLGYRALPVEPPDGARLRDVRFETADDVVGWVSEHMPGDAPESLGEGEYLAVVAYILERSQVDLGGIALSRERADDIAIRGGGNP